MEIDLRHGCVCPLDGPTPLQVWPTQTPYRYLFNPFTLLACLGRPTTVFTTFFVLLSISHACQAKLATSAFALAIATYISLHPAFLLPPIGLLCYDRLCQQLNSSSPDATEDPPQSKSISIHQRSLPSTLLFTLNLALTYLSALAFLLILSRMTLTPSWSFVPSVYLTPLQLPDLTPNSGLWWYFFTEMFDAFRAFFLGVFWLHMLAYSAPFSLRFTRQPLAAVVLMMGVCAVFEPYANIGDAGAWLSCLCLLGHTFEREPISTLPLLLALTTLTSCAVSIHHRYTFPALATLLYSALLGPAFHHLWLYAGSGNANFFYAITLVWNLALLVLLTDAVYAVLRDEWESERPEVKGKEGRQI